MAEKHGEDCKESPTWGGAPNASSEALDTMAELPLHTSDRPLPTCGCPKCAAADGTTIDHPVACDERQRRFLEACGGNVGKAAHLHTQMLLWRREFGVQALLEDADAAELRDRAVKCCCPVGLLTARDRCGRAIRLSRFGYCDIEEAARSDLGTGESGAVAFLRHHVWCNEHAARVQAQELAIIDLRNLSRKHLTRLTMSVLREAITLDQRFYPGKLHRVLVVNPPTLLKSVVWPAVRSWLSEDTMGRVRLLGDTREAATRAALLEEVAEQALPYCLGGTAAVGAVPVHARLREGAEAIDGETELTLPMGIGARTVAPLPSALRRMTSAPPAELLVRSLYSSTGTPSTAKVCVCFIDGPAAVVAADGAARNATTGATTIGPIDCAAQTAPTVHPLATPPAAATHIAVEILDEGGSWWRARTVFVEVSGIGASDWTVEVGTGGA